jgi:A/G-specific adenine glycosylase
VSSKRRKAENHLSVEDGRSDRHPEDAQRLLEWYERVRRDLPWRASRDPYCILVSEVMLQQTRVEVVRPYYERFVARFPSLSALASAPLADVLALWAGLGYYRRARFLHAAACGVMATSGNLPRSAEALSQLPGIGTYTAAAVASIAFGEAVPAVDGNIERVVARRLGKPDTRSAAGRRAIRAGASRLLVPERAGDSNQALMELGATVCVPRNPRCLACPIRIGCRAVEQGNPEDYPAARARRKPERRSLLVAVAERMGRTLLARRPAESALLAGTWELPWIEGSGERPDKELGAKYGGCWRLDAATATVRHGVTFRQLEVSVCRATVVGEPRPEDTGWFDGEEQSSLPRSALLAKVLRSLTPADAPTSRGRRRRPE